MRPNVAAWGRWTLAIGLLATLAACPKPTSSEYLRWAQMPYTGAPTDQLGVGDEFSIRVYQEPDMSGEHVVSATGTLNFPLIGDVVVLGRDCGAIESEISARLADGFLRRPSVSCQVVKVNSLAVVVSGDVGTPGVYSYSPNLTVVEAIAMAQGLTASAANDRVVVTRVIDGQQHEIVVPFQQIVNGRAPNFGLWPNDTVFVPSFRLIP